MTKPFVASGGDMAAIQFRCKDKIDEALAHIPGRKFKEGDTILLGITIKVTLTDAGNPHFGDITAKAKIRDAETSAET